jgi:uncharacterized protein (DUF2249 family)
MKAFALSIIVFCLVSCKQDLSTQQNDQVVKKEMDTIRCGNSQGLFNVKYYADGKQVERLPIGDKVKAKFIFKGNFKNILNKKGKLNLISDNDSILTIKQLSNDEFEFVVHKNTLPGEFVYRMTIEAPNTVFEQSVKLNGKVESWYTNNWMISFSPY